MLGKFFAFAMLVLIILLIVQFSTLSDEDIEKIKARIEQQKNDRHKDTSTESKNNTEPVPASQQ